jgi:1,4-dihydroxy-2-naphthoate octaprenyltransferase
MINPKIWAQALTTMPRLNAEQWRGLDLVARWLIACRASVLFLTLTAVCLGGLLAARDEMFQWAPFLLCMLGLVMAHASNNLLNDYTDSRRGLDKDNYYRNQYGVHILEDGLVSTREFWIYFAVTAAMAVMPGVWLVLEYGGATLHLMLAGAFFVLFYTWPLKYYGLGEPAVLLVWGPLMVGGTYYVITGEWSWPVTWLSLLFACGPTAVLFGKHIDKLDMDQQKGVSTLPVILGERRARYCVSFMLFVQYFGCAVLVLLGLFHWALLLVLLNLQVFRRLLEVYREPKPSTSPQGLPEGVWPLWFSAFAFDHTRRFTALFLLGLFIEVALKAA